MEKLFQDLEGLTLWSAVFGAVALATLIFKTALFTICARFRKIAERTAGFYDDLAVEVIAHTKVFTIFIVFAYVFLPLLRVPDRTMKVAHGVLVVTLAVQVAIWFMKGINIWRTGYLDRKVANDASSAAAIGLLATAVQALVVVTIFLIALSNLGIDVGALVAGLGIGGIAVALAAQNVLGDLLASLSIVLDKPFVVGDTIVVGDIQGTVENIGIKTTRLRATSGEQLIFSNKDLLESRIHNFKRMWERRVKQTIGVTYATSVEKLEQIPRWIQALVESNKLLRFDSCALVNYGGSSLDFDLAYFVQSPEVNVRNTEREKLMLAVLRKFSAEGVEFAFPTQTIFVEKMPPATSSSEKG
ncbi:MAG TPA: mechanosensitive ion channel family protein [Bdellovibrionales bacterium]|nr:mechanosensitive ion channel family protein [Bdellovibrionales bacterium]